MIVVKLHYNEWDSNPNIGISAKEMQKAAIEIFPLYFHSENRLQQIKEIYLGNLGRTKTFNPFST